MNFVSQDNDSKCMDASTNLLPKDLPDFEATD